MLFVSIALFCCPLMYSAGEEEAGFPLFNVVEKLLDKMIRMEIKGEMIDKEMSKTHDEVVSALQELKKEREKFKDDLADLKKQLKEDIKKELEDDIRLLRQETPTVIFKARSPTNLQPQQGETIIFPLNMLNYGDGYDNRTGVFTAPMNGTYLFTIHICVRKSQSMYYGIMYNNEIVTSGRFYDKDASVCYTADSMLPMSQGHKVWIQSLYGYPTSDILYEYSSSTNNDWNTFSGMLIHT